MRDVNRIPVVLKELEEIWIKNPDMRLGQLFLNVVRDPMLYYIEDDKLIEALKIFYHCEDAGN